MVPGMVPGTMPGTVPGTVSDPATVPGLVPGMVPDTVPGMVPGMVPGTVPGTVSDPAGRYPSRSEVTGDERSAWTAGMSVAIAARPMSAVATRRNDSGSAGATPKRIDCIE